MYINSETDETLSRHELQNRLNISFPPDKPPQPWQIHAPEPTDLTPDAEEMLALTRVQFRIGLIQLGTSYETILANITDPVTKVYFEEADDIDRDNPLTHFIISMIPATLDQVNNVWRQVQQIDA